MQLNRIVVSFLLLATVCLQAAAANSIHSQISSPYQALYSDVFGDYHFKHLTIDDGLSQNYVDYILKDSKGFLWFATWSGLDRYDGYQWRHYNVENQGLNTNFTHCLAEDNHRRLWVGTDIGLTVIDLTTGEPLDVFASHPNWQQLFIRNIYGLMLDHRGRLWVADKQGVHTILFDEQGQITHIYTFNTHAVRALAEDAKGCVWVGLANGRIHCLSLSEDGRYEYEAVPDVLKHKTFRLFNCFYFDRSSYFWIGTETGLFLYNPHTDRLDHFQAGYHPASLPNSTVTSVVQDKNGTVWVGTLAGLARWNPELRSFDCLQNDGTGDILNNNFVNHLYVDDQNILWIGTDRGGVNWCFEKRKLFNSLRYHPWRAGTIPPLPVNAIYEDADGNLLVGLVEGGLHIRAAGQQDFVHYYHDINYPTTLSQNTVSKILQDHQGRYWIGTWGGGLNRFYPEHAAFDNYAPSDSAYSISSMYVADLADDPSNGLIWVVLNNDLQYFEPETGRFCSLFDRLTLPFRPSQLYTLYLDETLRLWLGTIDGLYCFHVANFSASDSVAIAYDYYRALSRERPNDQCDPIISLFESKDGTLWIGSNGNGLYKMEEINGDALPLSDEWYSHLAHRTASGYVRFINYGQQEGFADKVIYTILEDNMGALWMSTNNGLINFNPRTKVCRNYQKRDGLLNNQFYWMAACKDAEGKLYFGNLNGINTVEPLRFKTNDYMPSVNILSLRVLNQEVKVGEAYNKHVYLDKLLFETDRIVLPKKEKSFSFEFASTDYEFPEKIRYSYILEGFDNRWNEVDAFQRRIHYTNLRQGHYTLKVRCTNSDGEWSNQLTTLSIHIKPPFYQTIVFQLLAFLSVATVLLLLYRTRMTIKNKEHKALEEKVAERTLALQEASQRVRELTQDRLSFFTNITHEFKTPITLIRGPIRQLLESNSEGPFAEQLQMVDRNAEQLLSLVNQLMDFRKLEEGKMSLNEKQGNLEVWAREVLSGFEQEAEMRSIRLQFASSLIQTLLCFDPDKLYKVLNNLLSNAMKFTPDGGLIRLELSTLSVLEADHQHRVCLRVSDSGKGIPSDEREKVFDRFYQSHATESYVSSQSGTGVGLYLCKSLVELCCGSIKVEDSEIGGAAFVVELPLRLHTEQQISTPSTPLPVFVASNSDDSLGLLNDEVSIDDEKPLMLLVEDNADMRRFIASLLQNDFRMIEARDGVEGLEMAKEHLPDIIVSDVMMPRMDGVQLCSRLKNDFSTSHIPVLLLTALSSIQHQIDGLEAGADDYVPKPFEERLLRAKVKNIVKQRQLQYHRFEEKMDTKEVVKQANSPDKLFLDRVMQVMENHYSDANYDLTRLVQDVGISRSLFQKKMQLLVGQSVGRFMTSFRLNKAKDLLTIDNSLNISEIAYRVGFNDPKYFTRCFGKAFGCSPSAYAENSENRPI